MNLSFTSVDLADREYQERADRAGKQQQQAHHEAEHIWGSSNPHDLLYPIKENFVIDQKVVDAIKVIRVYLSREGMKADFRIRQAAKIIVAEAEDAVISHILENMEG